MSAMVVSFEDRGGKRRHPVGRALCGQHQRAQGDPLCQHDLGGIVPRRRGTLHRQRGGMGKGVPGRGLADQGGLGGMGAPRAGRDPAQGQAGGHDPAVLHMDPRRGRDDGKGIGRPPRSFR